MRRTFGARIGALLRGAALTAAGAAISLPARAMNPVTPCELAGTLKSVKSGPWSDPNTWGGRVPAQSDVPNVQSGHTVVLDVAAATVSGLTLNCGSALRFDPSRSVALQLTGNFVVSGRFEMKPAGAGQTHAVRFTGLDNAKFVGGGMDPLATDVGLWVMGEGQLDLLGARKTSWGRAAGAVAAGATGFALAEAPVGWAAGDELAIAPTEAPTNPTYQQFDERTLASVSGATIGLNAAVSRARPKVNDAWTAEVMNLTRNVRIEGTAAGKAHTFIRSSKPQSVKYVQFRHVGPRKPVNGVSNMVLGRYGLHFHHSMDGSRGSMIEGNVIRDVDNHAFVPHMSHGIVMRANVAYNAIQEPFWWDEAEPTHDALWDGNIAAKVNWVPKSRNTHEDIQFGASAYTFGFGEGNVAVNNVAVGVNSTDAHSAGAFNWEANNEGVWVFDNNIAHNGGCGLRTWQNTPNNHVIRRFFAYHNALGLFHGAYANSYKYVDSIFYGNAGGVELKAASSSTNGVRFENVLFDGAGLADYGIILEHSALPSQVPYILLNSTVKGHKKFAVYNRVTEFVHSIDVIHSNLQAPEFYVESEVEADETIRVQPLAGQPYQLRRADQPGTLVSEWNARRTDIPAFAPRVWGTGHGLKAEYFHNPNFTNPALVKIETSIMFQDWSSRSGQRIHFPHMIADDTYSVRWTGKLLAQYSEDYVFTAGVGGGIRITVGGKVVLDKMTEMYPTALASAPIRLVAGQYYDFKVEFMNEDDRSGMNLYWHSASQAKQYIPQSQLYLPDGFSLEDVPPVVPPANLPPLANAGADQAITLPESTAKLIGSASDTDGAVAATRWSLKLGPTAVALAQANALETAVTGLTTAGTYVFNLAVTDTAGAMATDEVMIVVKAANAPPIPPLAADAGADRAITLPTATTTLTAVATGGMPPLAYAWANLTPLPATLVATPAPATVTAQNLAAGAYTFRLTVTDARGASVSDTVQLTVRPAPTPSPTPSATPSPSPTPLPSPRPSQNPTPTPSPTVNPAPSCRRSIWNWFECDGKRRQIRRVYVR